MEELQEEEAGRSSAVALIALCNDNGTRVLALVGHDRVTGGLFLYGDEKLPMLLSLLDGVL